MRQKEINKSMMMDDRVVDAALLLKMVTNKHGLKEPKCKTKESVGKWYRPS